VIGACIAAVGAVAAGVSADPTDQRAREAQRSQRIANALAAMNSRPIARPSDYMNAYSAQALALAGFAPVRVEPPPSRHTVVARLGFGGGRRYGC
jgi:hypothetical protein